MKGLKLTQIKSHGFHLDFNRYQLWEHDLIPQHNRRPFWMPGRIIHHLRTGAEADGYFNVLAPQYDDVEFEILEEIK